MLGIKDDTGRWKSWWVNNSVPDIEGRVITFQADGHELELILRAMEQGFDYSPNIPKCPKCGSEKLRCSNNGCTWNITQHMTESPFAVDPDVQGLTDGSR